MKKHVFYILLIASTSFCCKRDKFFDEKVDFRQEMRNFVKEISQYSKQHKPGFVIIPQNGIVLVSKNLDNEAIEPATDYLNAIDGSGQEDLFYGYDKDDEISPAEHSNFIKTFLNVSKDAGNTILVTDYCSSHSKVLNSYALNQQAGYVSFAANQRALNDIPPFPLPIPQENDREISTLSELSNFLYLINPVNFSSKSDFIDAVAATNYDLLIMDLFFEDAAFTKEEVMQLRKKANGGKRLVVCYMSIGEAEDYRYYWQNSWNKKNNKPKWLGEENPNWKGNYTIKYWYPEWKNIIYGRENAYLDKIISADFDGVYLDIIDGFYRFEE